MSGIGSPEDRAQPWPPQVATRTINRIAREEGLTVTLTRHVREQMATRELIMSDVLYILKNGFVYQEPQTSTQPNLFKYLIETRTPNSGNRVVRAVAIPSARDRHIKIVTVMWVDE